MYKQANNKTPFPVFDSNRSPANTINEKQQPGSAVAEVKPASQ
jgi:hypothetical protein